MRTARLLVAPAAGALAAAASATPGAAHAGPPLDGFGDGALHPVLGLDHLLAIVAVGVLAAVGAVPAWRVPATFLGAMSVGALAGAAGFSTPGGEVALAGSLVVLGSCLAVPRAARSRFALPAVALIGALHGHAHGLEAPAAAEPVAYLAGLLVVTAALHATGVLTGVALRRRPAHLLGGLGAAVGAAGLLLLAAA